jgi:peptide/nickel transport system substrate-binding protein
LFKDKRIRQAIAYAIDKQEIINGVLLGKGQPATGPFPIQSWAYNSDVKDYEYDLSKARKLLEECGWFYNNEKKVLQKEVIVNGKKQIVEFSFTLITNQGNKARQLIAEIVQQQLKKLGIKVDILVLEWSIFINNYITQRNFDAVIL